MSVWSAEWASRTATSRKPIRRYHLVGLLLCTYPSGTLAEQAGSVFAIAGVATSRNNRCQHSKSTSGFDDDFEIESFSVRCPLTAIRHGAGLKYEQLGDLHGARRLERVASTLPGLAAREHYSFELPVSLDPAYIDCWI